MINLIKNALKFTHKGKIMISVSYDYDLEQLEVQIVDTGKGITEQEMQKLFVLFGKVERT